MSGDRYEIERSGDAVLIDGEHCWAVDGDTAELAVGQLLSDIDQLRADLAAAVAERDRLARSIEDDFSGWRAVEQRWRIRAEQAEARLAAIDGAPTVAIAVHTHTDRGPYKHLSYSELNVPRDGVELIARTAKD